MLANICKGFLVDEEVSLVLLQRRTWDQRVWEQRDKIQLTENCSAFKFELTCNGIDCLIRLAPCPWRGSQEISRKEYTDSILQILILTIIVFISKPLIISIKKSAVGMLYPVLSHKKKVPVLRRGHFSSGTFTFLGLVPQFRILQDCFVFK